MTNIVKGESERRQAAQEIADFITESGLTNPFGGSVEKSLSRKMRSIYVVLFSKPRTLDGVVEVYGKSFIRVISEGPSEMPASVFDSSDNAIKFIRLAWVNYDRDAALAVPTRGEST